MILETAFVLLIFYIVEQFYNKITGKMNQKLSAQTFSPSN